MNLHSDQYYIYMSSKSNPEIFKGLKDVRRKGYGIENSQ